VLSVVVGFRASAEAVDDERTITGRYMGVGPRFGLSAAWPCIGLPGTAQIGGLRARRQAVGCLGPSAPCKYVFRAVTGFGRSRVERSEPGGSWGSGSEWLPASN
jgi:hypothetical protein